MKNKYKPHRRQIPSIAIYPVEAIDEWRDSRDGVFLNINGETHTFTVFGIYANRVQFWLILFNLQLVLDWQVYE